MGRSSKGRRSRRPAECVRPGEQVADGLALFQGHQALPLMLKLIVQHVAPLAERLEISTDIICGVMVEMGVRQNDVRAEGRVQGTPSEAVQGSAAPADPLAAILVVPGAVTKVMHLAPVRTPTRLATALGTLEADHCRELRPIDRVQIAELL